MPARRTTPRPIAPTTIVARALCAQLAIGLASTVLAPAASLASDGTSEINQTCATQTGCFPGDLPGFPVTIDGSAGRAYRLASDLDLASEPGVSAILLAASFVDIDLAGHAIRGSIVCSGSPLLCPGNFNTGAGIEAAPDGPTGFLHSSAHIHDGTISGMAFVGILAGSAARIENVRVESNGQGGIAVIGGTRIRGCVVRQNGGYGINTLNAFLNGSVTLTDSTIEANDLGGVRALGGLLTGNSIEANEGPGIELFDAAVLSGNQVRDNLGDGILAHSASNLILENVVSQNLSDGVDNSDVPAPRAFFATDFLQRNVIENNASAGIRAAFSTRYRENVITSSPGGLTVDAPGANLGANACNGSSVCPP